VNLGVAIVMTTQLQKNTKTVRPNHSLQKRISEIAYTVLLENELVLPNLIMFKNCANFQTWSCLVQLLDNDRKAQLSCKTG
jgi:hypothetical protein